MSKPKAAKRTPRTPKKPSDMRLQHSDATKAAALKAYSALGTVTAACQAAKVARRTWYDWMEADTAFASQVYERTEDVTDELEQEAIRRAKDGSDVLLIFLLKSNRPAKYRERQEVTIVSPDIQQRLQRQVSVIASRQAWAPDELLAALDEVWS